ncbi:helix-turn-helix domain-containing protein [Methylobacterium brachiatum]|uniref:helix-turn-helix domain-containing protein n=1 Tax=Methylobacterium brachiatum TaxID=269660 RepID=UPI000EFC1715|nr:helix-turn-helix transcriptional regulator [Methylobacterium brachiatum]AYO81072.1 XRE family transcriptional regulator [Methylobacterium brachiatum]
MSDPTEPLDEVLIRFHEAVDAITPEVIDAWVSDYPQYADAIRAEALEILNLAYHGGATAAEYQPRDYASKIQAAVRRAIVREEKTEVPDLRAMLERQHLDVRTFAGKLGIARSIVSDIGTGQIVPSTIPAWFRRAGAECLGCAIEWFEAILENSRPRAMTAVFKASDPPTTGRARTWDEAIRASNMSEDRKTFWLTGRG